LLFGPDVQENEGPAAGIFGMTHEQLLQSEWVQDDTLTVKFELEVREAAEPSTQQLAERTMPPANVSSNLLSMLEAGKCSDVTFIVKGEPIRAHSQVLGARSEVFERLFYGNMQESVSKEVVVDDCEPHTFQSLLKYLYTDDFSHVEKLTRGGASSCDSTGGSVGSVVSTSSNSPQTVPQILALQDLLSLAHKYQISGLTLWCEQRLCTHVTVADVCSLLCQAHLYEAKQLEQRCLNLIRENVEQVVGTEGFVRLSVQWPEVLLKVSLSNLGASNRAVASALEAQQAGLRKRKREGQG